MSHWRLLLDRAINGLTRFQASGQPVPDWVLGGGTALMIHSGHRLSKDIDAFVDDPQYLSLLSPRLGGEEIWGCEAYEEAGNYLKLVFPEGEIDFIVAGSITDLMADMKTIEMRDLRPGTDSLFPGLLRDNLHRVTHQKQGISERLAGIQEVFFRREIDELAILDGWRPLAAVSLQRVREIIDAIPEAEHIS